MNALLLKMSKSIHKNELKFFRKMMKKIAKAKAKAKGEQA